MQKITIIIVLAFVCTFFYKTTMAKTTSIDFKDTFKWEIKIDSSLDELRVGDKLPEALWNLHMKVLNHQRMESEITLNAYRGKLIILDFWATNCSSCISAIPKLNNIQEEFLNEIAIFPVTNEKRSVVNTALRNKSNLKKSKLVNITDEVTLKRYFPHRYISHLVWIDQRGIIRAFTRTNYVTSENVKAILNNETINWPIKRDLKNFDYKPQLLAINTSVIPKCSIPITEFHSSIMGNLENVSYRFLTFTDTINQTFKLSIINHSIKDLYLKVLMDSSDDYPISKIYTDPSQVHRFFFDKNIAYKEQWDLDNTFCYEAVFPLSTTPSKIKEKVKQDLDFYFGLRSNFEEVKVKCLIISNIRGNLPVKKNWDGEQSLTLQQVIYYLNHQLPSCPVIDETDKGNLIPIRINSEDLINIPLLKLRLSEQGFEVTERFQNEKMFVLKGIPNSFPTKPTK